MMSWKFCMTTTLVRTNGKAVPKRRNAECGMRNHSARSASEKFMLKNKFCKTKCGFYKLRNFRSGMKKIYLEKII